MCLSVSSVLFFLRLLFFYFVSIWIDSGTDIVCRSFVRSLAHFEKDELTRGE